MRHHRGGRNRSPMSYSDWDEKSDEDRRLELELYMRRQLERDPRWQAARRRLAVFLLMVVLLVAVAVGLYLHH